MIESLRRQRWWLGRMLIVPLHLLVFTIATFLLIRSVPGDPVLAVIGDNNWGPEEYERMQVAMGLDGSIWSQLVRYISGLFSLNLGNSLMTGRPVVDDLATRIPATVELAMQALICAIVVSLVASYFVVMHPRNPIAQAIRTYSRGAGAIPEYVLAVAGLFIFYTVLRWAPAPLGRIESGIAQPEFLTGLPLFDAAVQGRWDAVGSMLAHLVIPITVMTIAQSALLIKMLTASLEHALDAAPTRFRIASGAGRGAVVLSVYRRALPPTITLCGTVFGYMLGGAVIIESLFGFNGLGRYAVEAVSTNDYIGLQGFLLVVATISLMLFLVVDIINMLVDPRRRPGVRTEQS